ncbi:GNAT family N-acetyltransferase [Alloalcanivorax gelatiniphagus]|uniref:GNAT family N-acetyltransferase n=1 Tax=Alloalcanivorax gelatiniphagus TaxID=1194167 RepID=A0ABY2XKN4_9GAMM|nr:GNAT family N-acetyltransferase [Alloalcanivorax gelatiniphagus]TMW12595.1 GNAT family N-acetyltransferase [Alloalcanivorax gelatiniphagus]
MARWIEPVTLEGDRVCLEPLAPSHADDLTEACRDGELWKLWFTFAPAPQRVDDYIQAALAGRDQGDLPFAVRHRESGRVIGTTRFFKVDEDNRRLELGHTWYAGRYQRTGVNTECKWLLLRHAFESLDAIAVEFRTHWHNRASRAAIARLGAKQDGVLRNHTVTADGIYRDTVVFSIINQEWPAVRQNLRFLLERQRP